MRIIMYIANVLVLIGALNWGLVGIFDWNAVDAIFGAGSALARLVYAIVGISAIVVLITFGASASSPARRQSPAHDL